MSYKVLFLCVDCDTSRMIFHEMQKHWYVENVIIENAIPLKNKLRSRIRKRGLIATLGQIILKLTIDIAVAPFSRNRRDEILREYECVVKPFSNTNKIELQNIHDGNWEQWILDYKPDFIMINGTRILKKTLLDKFSVPVINIHAGITPMYRGVHGGYWALANKDNANFGATIHLVDTGIDTGAIIGRVYVEPLKNDNFYTYPYLQCAAATKQLVVLVNRFLTQNNTSEVEVKKKEASNQWYYPTFYQYIYNLLTKGVY